ncbi:hypothetical protein BGX21_003691 [Mortierella sp. AD011]|nr:hypothetical protein BGX20_004042 [Mortierella sp. AD010]KAF9400703.1 hypothetical protein BGX21_003691 [Mortierella sp. AD011]
MHRFEWTWALRRFQARAPPIAERQEGLALEFIASHPDLEEITLKFHTIEPEDVLALTAILRQQHPLQKQKRCGDQQQKYNCRHHHRLRKISVEYDIIKADRRDVYNLFVAATEYSRSRPTSCLKSQLFSESSQQPTCSSFPPSSLLETNGPNRESLEEWHFNWINSGLYTTDQDESDSDNDDESSDQEGEIGGEHSNVGDNSYPALINDISSGISDLAISFNKPDWDTRLLLPMLRMCPDLERLSLPNIQRDSIHQSLPLLLKSRCTKVRGLEFSSDWLTDEKLASILESCIAGLSSFSTLNPLPVERVAIQALSRAHGNTLEKLDFGADYRWACHYFQELVSNCPRLRFLRASLELHGAYDDGTEVDYDALTSDPWPFLNHLKFLDLTLYHGSELQMTKPYRPGDGSVSDMYVNYLYSQIGGLIKLEELRIGGWMMLLQAQNGLRKLAGLKKLKVLDLRNHTFIKWGTEEAEWICENWTGLVEILGLKGPNTRDVVKIIKERRPLIVIK